MLRGWFEWAEFQGTDLAGVLVDKILDAGLEPTAPPLPLPPIDQEEIKLFLLDGNRRGLG